MRGRAIRGHFVHAPDRGAVEVLEDAVVFVGEDGRIERIAPARDGVPEGTLDLPPDRLVIPGFVDLHVHAPQYPQLGLALDEPLEVWLGKYTFPLEARYADLDFAREAYGRLVKDLLAGG
ncbi:MAG: amidohydrolase family protein, partial [Devosia sp.]|nr:amidohydrolase family protein [Devosia sp.]